MNINETYAAAWGSIDAPMGGWGDSGLGRRHGAEGLLQTTWAQTVARQRLRPVGEQRAADRRPLPGGDDGSVARAQAQPPPLAAAPGSAPLR